MRRRLAVAYRRMAVNCWLAVERRAERRLAHAYDRLVDAEARP